MAILTDARADLVALLTAAGVRVIESPSTGQMVPPAALVVPGAEWVIANTQLGAQLHGHVSLTVTFLAGRIAAGASLDELETLVELALPVLAPAKWVLGTIAEPFALTIAGTEYLAASATITRALVLTP